MPIAIPKGFKLAVTEGAVKRPGRTDMLLIAADGECSVAGTFTKNKVKAAPVLLDMVRTRYGRCRAIVVNSGNANACTGQQGMDDAREMGAVIAKGLGVQEQHVLVCSTGVIGVPMPMKRVKPALGTLIEKLGSATIEDAARAIMTTDTFPKFAGAAVKAGSVQGTVAAIAKGSGMIAPNLATMLAFIMTDLAVEKDALKAALSEAVEMSFNRITVDGECSTNDTALILASGEAENAEITRLSSSYPKFRDAICEITADLARQIAVDGEGASKLVEVHVTGAQSANQAKEAAMAIANSLLVKTAIYGIDPNWGRIVSALGASGVKMSEEKTEVFIGRVKVFSKGVGTGKGDAAKEELKGKEVLIRVAMNVGKAEARVLTCDLTEKYIKINAEYTT